MTTLFFSCIVSIISESAKKLFEYNYNMDKIYPEKLKTGDEVELLLQQGRYLSSMKKFKK